MTTSVTELKAAALEYQLLAELDFETELKPIRFDAWEPIIGFYVKGKGFRFAISGGFSTSVYFMFERREIHFPGGPRVTTEERADLVASVRQSISLSYVDC